MSTEILVEPESIVVSVLGTEEADSVTIYAEKSGSSVVNELLIGLKVLEELKVYDKVYNIDS